MLETGSLTEKEMSFTLENDPAHYVSDPVSVRKMINLLKHHGLIYPDAEGRWHVTAELQEAVAGYLSPSPLAQQLLSLAKELRGWVQGQSGLIDQNAWEHQFRQRVEAVAEKAKRDHAEVDFWLDKLPSAAEAVRSIAEALERVARRLPSK